MTVFDELFTDVAEPLLKETFGESVVHQAPDGTQTTLTAVFGPETTREEGTQNGLIRIRELPVEIFKSDLEDVVIKHGKLTRNGEVWTIDEVEFESGTAFGLSLLRAEPAEVSRPDFRSPQR